MILNTDDIQDISIQQNVKVFSDLRQAESICFFERDVDFNNETNLTSEAYWLSQIKDGSIKIVHNIADVTPNNEEANLLTSELGFSYPLEDGKYILTFKVDLDELIYNKIKGFEGQNLDFAFSDKTHVYVKNNFKGFETSSIRIKKAPLGQLKELVEITVEIEAIEFINSQIKAIDFDFSELTSSEVEITNFETSGTTSTFNVKDTLYNREVSSLSAADISFDDESGAITVLSVTQLSSGRFSIVVNSAITRGNISIDGQRYYSDDVYYNYTSILDVNFTNIVTTGHNKITFDLHEDVSGDPVTRTINFIVTDTDNGVLQTEQEEHLGGGSWRLDFEDEPIIGENGGTIDIVDVIFDGTGNYTSEAIDPVFVTFEQIDFVSRTQLTLFLRNALTSEAIIDPLITMAIDDDTYGSITIDTITSQGNGYYTLNLASDIGTGGSISVTHTDYLGESDYTYNLLDFTINPVFDYHINNDGNGNPSIVLQVLDTSNVPITGSVIADFELEDTLNGTISPTSVTDFTGSLNENWIVLEFGVASLLTGTITFSNDDGSSTRDYNVSSNRIKDSFKYWYTPVITDVGDTPATFKPANVVITTSISATWMDMRTISGGQPTDLYLHLANSGDLAQWTFDLNSDLQTDTNYRATLVFRYFTGSGTLTLSNSAQSKVITSSTASAGTVTWDFEGDVTNVTWTIENACTMYLESMLIEEIA